MNNYEHQQKDIDADIPRRGIFKGTGSGKSRIALLKSKGRTLIICPKTVRDKGHWEEEIKKVDLDYNRFTIISKEDFKIKWDGTYNSVRYFQEFTTIIGDEAHKLAGVQPATYQRDYKKYPKTSTIFFKLMQMIAKTNPDRIFLLTATPTSQPMTVWGLARLLGYNWDYFKFRDTFYFEKSRNVYFKKGFKRISKVTGEETSKSKIEREKYANLLANCVNHIGDVGRLQDWFDVPPQIYKEQRIAPTKGQKDCLKELQLLYPDPVVQLGKRHQLEQGIFEDIEITENKTKAIEDYIHEFGKVVVYCRYTAQINMYSQYFEKKKIHVLVMNGASKNRKEIIEEAESMTDGILIIQCQISEGYQLPSFPCMIFASEYGFTDRLQAEGRILRADNLKKNLYVTLICGFSDQRMRNAVESGEEFNEEVHAVNIANQNKWI